RELIVEEPTQKFSPVVAVPGLETATSVRSAATQVLDGWQKLETSRPTPPSATSPAAPSAPSAVSSTPPSPPSAIPPRPAHPPPWVRRRVEVGAPEPIALAAAGRSLRGHSLAFLLSGGPHRRFFERRALDSLNADRARLMLAMAALLVGDSSEEAIRRA